MPRLFDAYVVVDWSAAARPVTGADSIWVHVLESDGGDRVLERRHNPSTRHQAMTLLADLLSDLVARDRVVLVGFDFAFGYPAGFAARLGRARSDWRIVWQEIAGRIDDRDDNANNRFDVAADLNRQVSGEAFPFWSCPKAAVRPMLAAKRPRMPDTGNLAAFRLTDQAESGPKSVWQLFGRGSVGGQTLLGIAHLERLRRHPWLDGRGRVWPFETGLSPLARPGHGDWRVLFAEVYPSLLADDAGPEGDVKDARQVRRLARHFAHLDDRGELGQLFAGPIGMSSDDQRVVEQEEGWILGITSSGQQPQPLAAAAAPGPYVYVRDPAEIYRRSFATIRAEAKLDGLPAELEPLAVRLIHAAGDPAILRWLRASPGAATAGRTALALGRPILVDTGMVAAGISRRLLTAGNPVCCTLADPGIAERAADLSTTRSAAAVDAWLPKLAGAVVAIGNAPTALFRLLELLDEGAPPPAVILGFPVGFVGAAEAKDALIAHPGGVPYITVTGRRGGSAFAAAAVNALAGAAS